jgi:hypothetical protein
LQPVPGGALRFIRDFSIGKPHRQNDLSIRADFSLGVFSSTEARWRRH